LLTVLDDDTDTNPKEKEKSFVQFKKSVELFAERVAPDKIYQVRKAILANQKNKRTGDN
jgi:hypothetical protein